METRRRGRPKKDEGKKTEELEEVPTDEENRENEEELED